MTRHSDDYTDGMASGLWWAAEMLQHFAKQGLSTQKIAEILMDEGSKISVRHRAPPTRKRDAPTGWDAKAVLAALRRRDASDDDSRPIE